MIECKKATPADAGILAETRRIVWLETYRGIYPDELLDEYDVSLYAMRDREYIEDVRQHYYLFIEKDVCVGYFSYGPYHYGSYKDFEVCLNHLYIRDGYKGLGLGRRAIEQLSAFCREQHIDRFFCGCNFHNKAAMSFYKHMGGVMGDCPQFHQHKNDDIVHFEFYIGD